jgi:protein O-GlcNAc transferase
MTTIPEAIALALQHHQAGRLAEAEQIYRQVLTADPQQADAWHWLGVLALQAGQHPLAEEYIGRSVGLQPLMPIAHCNLGRVYRALGRIDDAVTCFRRALDLQPDYALAWNELGNTWAQQQQYSKAADCFRRTIEIAPGLAEAHCNLGGAFHELERWDEATVHFRRALELNPNLAVAHSNLGATLRDQRKLDEAVTSCRRALELMPDFAEAHSNLGSSLQEQGKLDEALTCFQWALELKPDFMRAHGSLLYTLQYRAGVTLAELFAAHADYARRHTEPLGAFWSPHANTRDPERRLRMGFCSPDLGRHPVGDFLIRTLENLDQKQVEVIIYSDRKTLDDRLARFRAAADTWHNVVGWRDDRLAEQIRADEIDILFDLAGHTGTRLLMFACKPAPIQITWIGYEGTTGLAAMDFILADRFEIPVESEPYYTERVLRMPEGHVCYEPPETAPPVSALPALERGRVTLGCFNNPAKITAQVIEIWARILRRLPEARLVLKFSGMTDAFATQRIGGGFVAHGIDLSRLEFLGYSPYGQHLIDYQQIDLALDPFPFCGGATTCEALWMGVPVVTCPGETFAGRHSLSYLSNIGLTETIARDLDDYVDLAVALAQDLPRLAAIRANLRTQMEASPLCNGPRFAENFTALMRQVWREWIAQAGSAKSRISSDT